MQSMIHHHPPEQQVQLNLKATANHRGSQFNTLEFLHKSDCPLHELEAFEAQEGIWIDQNNTNLVIQDNNNNYNNCLKVGDKPPEGINKVVYRKESSNRASKFSKTGGTEAITEQLQS